MWDEASPKIRSETRRPSRSGGKATKATVRVVVGLSLILGGNSLLASPFPICLMSAFPPKADSSTHCFDVVEEFA